MKIYTLHSKQQLPISKQQAWDFLSNPNNLKAITPKQMGFIIKSGADRPMYAGQIIHYTVMILGKMEEEKQNEHREFEDHMQEGVE